MVRCLIVVCLITLVSCQNNSLNSNSSKSKSKSNTNTKFNHNNKGIVSCALTSDELLLELGLGDEVIAFSSLATNKSLSLIADNPLVKNKKQASLSNVEAIVKLKPKIVITGDFSDANSLAMLNKMGIETIVLKTAVSFEDLYANITLLGNKLAKKEQSITLISKLKAQEQAMEHHLQKTKHSKKTLLFYSASSGVIAKNNSLDYIAGKANLVNLARKFKSVNKITNKYGMVNLQDEALLKLNPDYLVLNSYDGTKEYLQKNKILASLTAMQSQNMLIFTKEEEIKLYSISHYMLDSMWTLHKKIYKED